MGWGNLTWLLGLCCAGCVHSAQVRGVEFPLCPTDDEGLLGAERAAVRAISANEDQDRIGDEWVPVIGAGQCCVEETDQGSRLFVWRYTEIPPGSAFQRDRGMDVIAVHAVCVRGVDGIADGCHSSRAAEPFCTFQGLREGSCGRRSVYLGEPSQPGRARVTLLEFSGGGGRCGNTPPWVVELERGAQGWRVVGEVHELYEENAN